jgi:beta-mannosidase
VVNGRPVFLQGVNFAPLCANFADLKPEQYERRLRQYHALGLNLFRINACQFLEREWFYDLCDELGLMIWQEFPLTSSGLENWPPEDEASIASMAEIAKSFVTRRHHHAALLMWSGGNELQ